MTIAQADNLRRTTGAAQAAATTARLLVQLIRLASAGQASAVQGFMSFRRR